MIQDDGGTAGGGDDDTVLSIASTVSLTALNDAPTLTASGDHPSLTEGGAVAGLFSGTNVGVIEAGQLVSSITLTLAGLQNGADEILPHSIERHGGFLIRHLIR